MDNMRDTDCAVALRYSYFLYDGWFYSYSTRDCHYSRSGSSHSGTESLVGQFNSLTRYKKMICNLKERQK